MFIRQKKNKSGSTSIQIISKNGGSYKILKSIGSSSSEEGISILMHQARFELGQLQAQPSLFVSDEDTIIQGYLETISNYNVQVIGPELIFGKIYDHIGYNSINEDLFRYLVISRLAFPLSKLKTLDYLQRFQGIQISASSVYRFLDKLQKRHKEIVEQIAYQHTLKITGGKISIVFYDMTTLYFESSDEDDLRKAGFSKDGKHSNPQIFLGLLVSVGGYAIGYDMFEGNIFEGHTLIPFLEKMSARFNLSKPIVVADAGLLSKPNIEALQEKQYEYIIGARLKSEPTVIKTQIEKAHLKDGQSIAINKGNYRLIVAHSNVRSAKDAHNRKRGLQRLEKQIQKGKLTKTHINNRGYNKYLKLKGEVSVSIDYDKYNKDAIWDGLKGYITNCTLPPKSIIENYRHLWQIEKAFRMSKTDLKIRPIYHRLADRIEAHICISFVAYSIYKELERVLKKEKSTMSLVEATEQTQNMYQLNVTLPDSKRKKNILLKMTEKQIELMKIIAKNY
ncbi:MAG: IS1634 family transposase [Bacteroidia bacterium]|nr:IS1634 family transposase [Bacteroidia bacterium]